LDARADFLELVRLLEHLDRDALARQRQRSGQAADPAVDDEHLIGSRSHDATPDVVSRSETGTASIAPSDGDPSTTDQRKSRRCGRAPQASAPPNQRVVEVPIHLDARLVVPIVAGPVAGIGVTVVVMDQ
jgi:hypothetical protein